MRKLVQWLGAASVAASLVATPAAAQMEAGDKSISVQGTLSASDASTSGSAFGGLNYYQTKNFAWRVNAMLLISDAGNNETSTTTLLGGGVEWNFVGDSKSVPYIAFDLNQFISDGFNDTQMSPSVGLRSFLNRNASFDTALAYRTSLSSDTSGGGTLDLRVGLSFYFGKDSKR